MFPERARIYIAGLDDSMFKTQEDKTWLHSKYGVDMKCIRRELHKYIFVDLPPASNVVTTPCKVLDLDLRTCQVSDLEFQSAYELKTYPTKLLNYE
jgi:protein arginine N-methyltransferase 1